MGNFGGFCKERIAFVVLGDTICLQDKNDARTCYDWMTQDLYLPPEAYETFTRGYIMHGRIQFFTSGNKYTVSNNVSGEVIKAAIRAWTELSPANIYNFDMQNPNIIIGNGCIVGYEDEWWPPVLVYKQGFWRVVESNGGN